MDAETINMMEEEAEKAYKEYSELIKTRSDGYLKVMKDCTYHLSKGRKIINIYDVIKKGGVDGENHEPRLAIGRADWGEVVFSKREGGAGTFSDDEVSWRRERKDAIHIPIETFKEWEPNDPKRDFFSPIRRFIDTPIPNIPHQLTPKGKLNNYYILFEAETWTERSGRGRVGDDPMLLKRLSENMFVVLGVWDMTPLEKAVLEGM